MACTSSAALRVLVFSGPLQAINRSYSGVSPSSVVADSCFWAQSRSNLIEQQQRKQMAQTQAAIRHCWCRTRIRCAVGSWYQKHSWQSTWLEALNVPQNGRSICFTQGPLRPHRPHCSETWHVYEATIPSCSASITDKYSSLSRGGSKNS